MDFDVAIVGGGPAGTSTARAAAEAGARVLLLERQAEIGNPIHTSGASSLVELRELGMPEHLLHPIPKLAFLSPNQRADFAYDPPLACVMDVRGVYQHLAGEAARAGAAIWLKARAQDAQRVEGGWRLAYQDRQGQLTGVTSRLLVDASGFKGVVARQQGLYEQYRRYGIGAEYDLFAPHCDPDLAVIVVGDQVAPSGYAWLAAYAPERVRVGVGIIHPDSTANPQRYLDAVLELPSLRPYLRGAQPLEFHVGMIPSEGPRPRFVADALLLVGDSAGQASTLLGEGIRYSIQAGKLAGAAIGRALKANDTSQAFLAEHYQRPWDARYRRDLRIAQRINERIARYDDARWDARVALLKGIRPDLFALAMQSRFSLSFALRLALHHPGLMRAALGKLAGALR